MRLPSVLLAFLSLGPVPSALGRFSLVEFREGERADEPKGLLVLDRDARPGGRGPYRGVLFTVSLETGEIVSELSHPDWSDPTDLVVEPDGSIVIVDYTNTEAHEPPLPGALYRVPPSRDRIERVPIPPGLLDPYSVERAPDGSLWILDKNADPRRRGKGTLWRLGRDGRTLSILSTGPPLLSPAAVLFDSEGAILLDADAGPERSGTLVRLGRGGSDPRPLAVLGNTLSPLDLIPFDDGFLLVDTNRDPRDPTTLFGSLMRLSETFEFVSLVAPGAPFVDPIRAVRHGSTLWVVDASADPLDLGPDPLNAERIAALRRDGHLRGEGPPRNMVELLSRSTPGTGEPVYPIGFGGFGRGAVWQVDAASGEWKVLCASERFVTPIGLAVDSRRR